MCIYNIIYVYTLYISRANITRCGTRYESKNKLHSEYDLTKSPFLSSLGKRGRGILSALCAYIWMCQFFCITYFRFVGTVARLFPKDSESAFCAFKFWESIGLMVPFAYSKYFCTSTKLWIVIVLTVMCSCCFIALEKSSCTRKTIYGTVAQNEINTRAKPDQGNENTQRPIELAWSEKLVAYANFPDIDYVRPFSFKIESLIACTYFIWHSWPSPCTRSIN